MFQWLIPSDGRLQMEIDAYGGKKDVFKMTSWNGMLSNRTFPELVYHS